MIQWNAKDSFVFDCSIKFECHDESIKEQSFRNEAVLGTNTIASLHENKNFADFTFIVRGQEFKVHKNLLNEASPVFKSIFASGLDEIKVDCNPEIFGHIIKFIYTNVLPMYDEMTFLCFDLYKLAHQYGIDSLAKICNAIIMNKKIDSANALDIYEFALTHDVQELTLITWEFIKV